MYDSKMEEDDDLKIGEEDDLEILQFPSNFLKNINSNTK
jgi:hypothetical protein